MERANMLKDHLVLMHGQNMRYELQSPASHPTLSPASTAASEADLRAEAEHLTLKKVLEILAEQNICRSSYDLPFNVVADLQWWASSITINTMRPLSTLMHGLQDVLVDLTLQLNSLLFRFDAKLDIPDAPVNSWSNNQCGYSFVNNHKYIPLDSLIRHLLHLPVANLTWTDAKGCLHFKLLSINRIVVLDAAFLKLFCPFIAVACLVTCITEFLSVKIKNSTCPRTRFVHLREMWIITQRMKWENLVCHAVFVLHLAPEPIHDLLLHYILIFCPVLMKLLHIANEEQNMIL
ncbi:hypothetical protein B0H13DRAFT_2334690 [Mycena leptocephala]|nr:hypothetical protein B0H13DRAFT_2334690 [Mycena leptocephala]